MIVPVGATSQSINLRVVNDSGVLVSGLVAATFPRPFRCLAGAGGLAIAVFDLASVNDAWLSGGVVELSFASGNYGASQRGVYRFDLPDDTFAIAGTVTIVSDYSGHHIVAPEITVASWAAGSGSGGTVNVGDTAVNSNTSGTAGATTANYLSVMKTIGMMTVGVSGAQVLAYLTSEYAGNPNTAPVRGFAVSKDDGSWTGMFLNSGLTYTIFAHAPDGSTYGPKQVTV